MPLKDIILERSVRHWNQKFTGFTALSLTDQLGVTRDEILAALAELETAGMGTVGRDAGLFFPSKFVLTEFFHRSGMARQDLPEYSARLHKGFSQIAFIYFELAVLQRYLDHPERYVMTNSVDGGSIRMRWDELGKSWQEDDSAGAIANMRFGKRALADGTVSVTAILWDLAELPEADQRYWHAHEIGNPNFSLHDPDFVRYVKRDFNAEFVEGSDPLQSVLASLAIVNALVAPRKLFRNESNPYLSYPAVNTGKDFCDRCSELYKLIGPDNLDQEILKQLLMEQNGLSASDFVHRQSERPLSTLQLLWLLMERIPSGEKLRITLEKIASFRVEADHKITDPVAPGENYHLSFRQICEDLDEALEILRSGLAKMLEYVEDV